METISGCSDLKVTLKAKVYLYINSTFQRCPTKIIFMIEDFFHLPPVSRTPAVHLELRTSSQILNGPYDILRGLGKTDA
jgi:hypothetical protein